MGLKTALSIYAQASSELLDFVLRKFSDDCEKIEPVQMRKYLDAVENILQFQNDSCDLFKMAKLKIKDKVIKSLPMVFSVLKKPQSPKKLSIEWKRFLFLNIFTSFINCGYEKEVESSLESNNNFVLEFLFDNEIVSKDYLTKLDK